MKNFYAWIFTLLVGAVGFAQCDYQLILQDNFGSAWPNSPMAGVNVTINGGTPTFYTIQNAGAVPNIETFAITVNDGDAIVFDYTAPNFSGDGEWRLNDSEGLSVFDSGFNPNDMADFTGTASCPTCPVVTNIVPSNVLPDSVQLDWTAGGTETEWIVEYGVSPLTLGTGLTETVMTNPTATIDMLNSVTTYDFYVYAVCGPMDQSNAQGPVTVMTAESCAAPSNFNPVTTTANNAQFTWDANGNPSPNSIIEYGFAGFVQGAGQEQGFQNSNVPGFANITGLMSDTNYDFYVRIDCGMGDFSLWAGPYNAQTQISCPAIGALSTGVLGSTTAEITWNAGGTETEWEVEFATAGTITSPGTGQGTTVTPNVTGSPSTTLTMLTENTEYDVYVRAVCDPNMPDFSTWEDISFFTNCLPIDATTAMPYVEDFETFTASTDFQRENCWSAESTSTSAFSQYEWSVTNSGTTPSTNTGPDSANSGTDYLFIETGGANNDIATLFSPIINVDGLTNPSVQFFYHLYGANMGDLSVDVFDGTAWQNGLFTSSGQVQTDGSDPFEEAIIDLAGYTGDIQVRFVSSRVSFTTGDMAIDDFTVSELPTCPRPDRLGTVSLLDTTAALTWREKGTATMWDVEVQLAGDPLGTMPAVASVIGSTTNPTGVTGLTAETDYEFYVRASCGTNDMSDWTGPFAFTTACAATVAPYNEDFETFTDGVEFNEENCWTASFTSNLFTEYSWNVEDTAGTPTSGTGPDGANSGSTFFFVEGNGGNLGDEASLFTPVIDLSALTAPSMSFASHLYGVDIGILHVDIDDGSGFVNDVLVLVGEQQFSGSAPFDIQTVDLASYAGSKIQVRFRAEQTHTSTTDLADIAIDDVVFDELPSCPQPTQLVASNVTDVAADLNWTENGTATSWNVEYGPCGFAPGTMDPAAVTLVATSNMNFNISGLTAFTCYEYYITSDCGMGDLSATSGPASFTTACTDFIAPYTEGFESFTATTTAFPTAADGFVEENCWSGSQGAYNWVAAPPSLTASFGTGPDPSVTTGNYMYTEAGSGATGSIAELTSPNIDISSLTNPELRFDYHMAGTAVGTLETVVSIGGVETIVSTFTGVQQTADTDPFLEGIVDLAPFANQTITVIFRATRSATFSSDIAVDNFSVQEAPDCTNVSDLMATAITDTTANFSWTENDSATTWEYEYGVAGFSLGSGIGGTQTTMDNVTNSITGLMAQTNYEFYVRSLCPAGGQSAWVGPLVFRTACTVFSTPFFEDFEMFTPTTSAFPSAADGFTDENCWTGTANAYNWVTAPANLTASTGTGPDPSITTGNYMYTEAGNGATDNIADLTSPLMDLSSLTAPELRFDYHMAGAAVGSLEVLALVGTVETSLVIFNGAQQVNATDAYLPALADLSAFTGQTISLIFRGTRGSSFSGDIAIDNVSVNEAPTCPNVSALMATDLTDTSADLNWIENGTAVSWEYEYDVTGYTFGMSTLGVITTADNATNVINGLLPETTYDFYVRSECPAGGFSNWVGPVSFTTECAAFTAPYLEDFENFTAVLGFEEENCWKGSSSSPSTNPFDWNVEDNGGTPTANTGPSGAFSGSTYFYVEGNGGAVSDEAVLISPIIDVSGLTTPSVQFYYHMFGDQTGILHVDINDGSGAGFVNDVVLLSGQQQLSSAAAWELGFIDLTAFTGTNVQVRFRAERTNTSFNGRSDISIDDVRVDEAPSCPQPSALDATMITETTADLSWFENGVATEWEVEYDLSGYTLGSSTNPIVNAMTNPETSLSGLTDNTAYDYYVRAICGSMDVSLWTGPFSFRTLIVGPQGVSCNTGSPGFIYEESFDADSNATNWTGDVGTLGGEFQFGVTGTTGSTGTGPLGPQEGTGYMHFDASGTNVGPNAIVSPPIDLTNANDQLELSFLFHAFGGDQTTLEIGYSTSATGPFTNVFTFVGQLQSAQSDPFQSVGIDLPTTLIGQIIYIQIQATEEVGNEGGFIGDVAFDQFRIETCGSFCNAPSNVTVNTTSSSATIDWTENGTATTWEVAIVPDGNGTPTTNGVSTTNKPYTDNTLIASTDYEVYVRADCGGGLFSDWTSTFAFSTPCAPFAVPYGANPTAGTAAGNDFTTFPGQCWEEGQDTDIASGPNGVDGEWQSDDFGNDTASPNGDAARINLFGAANTMDWLVTPEFDLGTGTSYAAYFDIAQTAFADTVFEAMGSDDEVRFLITNDGGATWITLQTWDVTTNVSNTGEPVVVDLSAYSGLVTMAFWGTEGSVSDIEDFDFFVDNFSVDVSNSVLSTEELGFNFYPNPTQDVINIVSPDVAISKITVRNMLGQEIVTLNPESVQTRVDLSEYSVGVYLIEVQVGDKRNTVRVIRE